MNNTEHNNRITIVDALRGFALLLIVLIHYVEHFDFFKEPLINFFFSAQTDHLVIGLVFLLISGKAYSIFALLFGFSFFIQMNRAENKGTDFRGRFLWRLTVLLIFGFIHSLLYKGDILHIYALLGIPLVFIYKIKTKYLYALAFLLALQIPLLYNIFASFLNPQFIYDQSFGAGYWQEGNQVFAHGSFSDVLAYNLWKGRANVWGWTYYNGRYMQLLALFVAGFILGRKRIFENISMYRHSLVRALIISAAFAVIFIWSGRLTGKASFNEVQSQLLSTVITSYINLAVTSLIICAVTLLYLKFRDLSIFNLFACYGRMSLSNYVFQVVFGVLFFYGFGLGMYRYMGSTWSVLFGALVFYIQAIISRQWIRHYYYGPLEWLWRAFTFFDFHIKMKKPASAAVLSDK